MDRSFFRIGVHMARHDYAKKLMVVSSTGSQPYQSYASQLSGQVLSSDPPPEEMGELKRKRGIIQKCSAYCKSRAG